MINMLSTCFGILMWNRVLRSLINERNLAAL